MKRQAKSTKSQPQPKPTAAAFGKWLRSIPQHSDLKVTLQPPVSLTQTQWTMLAVEAARRGVTLDRLLQGSINTFAQMVEDDLARAA